MSRKINLAEKESPTKSVSVNVALVGESAISDLGAFGEIWKLSAMP